jgi:hypothetical protein
MHLVFIFNHYVKLLDEKNFKKILVNKIPKKKSFFQKFSQNFSNFFSFKRQSSEKDQDQQDHYIYHS